MRIWIYLANSPHVALFEPVVRRLREEEHELLLTARDHAQTIELAQACWPDLLVIGGESPAGRVAKGLAVARRAEALRRLARREHPQVALSHGSYAQLVAARAVRVPSVTMMDYEYQPANHLSFRAARRVIVPGVFPEKALRRFGAAEKVVRYPGFKEELYLAGFRPDTGVLDRLELDSSQVIAVFRPPPEGALYHRMANERFDEIVASALANDNVQIVLLARTREQRDRYGSLSDRVRIPEHAVDGRSLVALADLTVGAGGTMNRESALLGTPTYTVFAGRLAAVDAELIRVGRLCDLREPGRVPHFEKKPAGQSGVETERAEPILDAILRALS